MTGAEQHTVTCLRATAVLESSSEMPWVISHNSRLAVACTMPPCRKRRTVVPPPNRHVPCWATTAAATHPPTPGSTLLPCRLLDMLALSSHPTRSTNRAAEYPCRPVLVTAITAPQILTYTPCAALCINSCAQVSTYELSPGYSHNSSIAAVCVTGKFVNTSHSTFAAAGAPAVLKQCTMSHAYTYQG